MRLLKRHSDEDEASVDTDRGLDAEGPAAPADRHTIDTERVVDDRVAQPARPGLFQRFRRTVTVPMTVPRRSVRRTVTIPARRRIEPTTAGTTVSLASILATVAGAALAVIGIVAIIRTGLDETWFRPVVEVLNADHTALLGAIEIGAGLLLVLLGLAGTRLLVAMAGIAGALLSTAAAVEPEELQRELAIESWWAWILAAAGVVLTLAALQEPRTRARRDTVIDVR